MPGKGNPVPRSNFRIAGVGASAGGLSALRTLLEALPEDPNVALIVVQHLAPAQESALVPLLGRATPLPVLLAEDGAAVEPNHIYVIPPNASLRLEKGRLRLGALDRAKGTRALIDILFESLSLDEDGRGVAVVLSGTGSDGTEGMRVVKGNGGITFAQDPRTAESDGMPRSAISAGCADYILPPDEIARVLARIGHQPASLGIRPSAELSTLPPVQEALRLLRDRKGVDFSEYRMATLERRLARRMTLNQIDSVDAYVAVLRERPEEIDSLFDDLLIHVTRFFRDEEAFAALERTVFPELVRLHDPSRPVRIWVAGCATGEEVYSIAISAIETFERSGRALQLQIFGTDLSDAAIQRARTGLYPPSVATTVSPERLRRFFVERDGELQITKSIRDVCIFARQDVTRDAPFSHLDLISFRNVLIYLGPSLQKRVLSTLHYALSPGGMLLLGSSETVTTAPELFTLVDRKVRLYRKKGVQLPPKLGRAAPLELGAAPPPHPARAEADPVREAERMLLSSFGPPAVLVDQALEIVHLHGEVGQWVRPSAGTATLNLLKMLPDELALEVRSGVQQARRSQQPVTRAPISLPGPAPRKKIRVGVRPLRTEGAGGTRFFLVVFEELAVRSRAAATQTTVRLPGGAKQAAAMRDELAAVREHLQAIVEENQINTQELTAAHEEAQSANEELQSTNEELETAKEELQSTNEELSTVNEELQSRNSELGQLNDDLRNLLASASIATVILDPGGHIRRYTPICEQVLDLRRSDVGRKLSDLKLSIEVPALDRLLDEVGETLGLREWDQQARDGRWYTVRVRPYRTADNKIDGSVVTFAEVDRMKRALDESTRARQFAEAIVSTVRTPLVVVDGRLCVTTVNAAFQKLTGGTSEETIGESLFTLGGGEWNVPELRKLVEEVLPRDRVLTDYPMEAVLGGERRRILINARRLEHPGAERILLSFEAVGD